MVFKINISDKSGKTYKLELESECLIGKELGSKIDGKEILPALEGYELEITGTSDKAVFTSLKSVEGVGLKKVLLSYEKAMKKRPRHEGKGKRSTNKPKGLRLRKTVRGKVISSEIVQINMKIIKAGPKPITKVFPDQNKTAELEKTEESKPVEKSVEPEKSAETPKEEAKSEEKPIEETPKPEPETKPAEPKKAEEKKEETNIQN